LRFPSFFTGGFFTHQGPTEEQRASTSGVIHFRGEGTVPGGGQKVIRSKISFPEPGYVATSRIVVACALSLLLERAPDGKGGVFTSAVAFEKTQLRQRLERRGVCFEVDVADK